MVKINQPLIKKSVLFVALLLLVMIIYTCTGSTQSNITSKDSMKVYLKDLAGTGAPQTARQLEAFKAIKSNYTMRDIFLIVGAPDDEVGSGLYIFVYNLEDGTKVMIGISSINGAPQYVTHILEDESSTQMLQK